MADAFGIVAGNTLQVKLKQSMDISTGTPNNTGPASGSNVTSVQNIKECVGVVQTVDGTTGIMQLRVTLTVGSTTKQVDLFIPLSNIVGAARLV
jgi:hypothetical protein